MAGIYNLWRQWLSAASAPAAATAASREYVNSRICEFQVRTKLSASALEKGKQLHSEIIERGLG